MDKQEFLVALRESLSGEVPEQEVNNSIRYYEEYLVDEAGTSLEDKIMELGEPRLIAKTIIDAYIVNHEGTNYKSYGRDYEDVYEEKNGTENIRNSNVKIYNWNTMAWYQKLLVLVLGCIIISVLVSIFVWGVNIFFSFIFPIIMILFGIRMLMRLFR